MWNLDDMESYVLIHSFKFSAAFTYADTRAGHTDREKRELIRRAASKNFPAEIPKVAWWAFRIFVQKPGISPFDIENVPKLIVDSFCRWQIRQDGSSYIGIGLYDNDTIDYVRVVEVGGERSREESTVVEIFGRKS